MWGYCRQWPSLRKALKQHRVTHDKGQEHFSVSVSAGVSPLSYLHSHQYSVIVLYPKDLS